MGKEGEIELSIEETNRVRLELGLKPLKVETKEVPSKEQAQVDNFNNLQREKQKAKQAQDIKKNLQKSKDKRKLNEKLVGKTLADGSDEEEGDIDDAAEWIKRQKIASLKKEQEIEEMEKEIQADLAKRNKAKYSRKDLKGLRIAHDVDDVMQVGETILTLKDSTIQENEEDGFDQLENITLAENSRTRKKLEDKKKNIGYNAYDDQEFLEPGKKRKLLSQYDDQDEQDQTNSGFTIDESGGVEMSSKNEHADMDEFNVELQDGQKRKFKVNLDYSKTEQTTDYYTAEQSAELSTTTFKKKKQKKSSSKKRNHRVKLLDDQEEKFDNDGDTLMGDGDGKKSFSNSNFLKLNDISDVNFVDDDELQNALSRARKVSKTKRGEDIIRAVDRLNEVSKQEDRDMQDDESNSDLRLILSATSEFVNNLSTNITAPSSPIVPKSKLASAPILPVAETVLQEADVDGDEIMQDVAPVETNEKLKEKAVVSVVEDEPLVASGMAATVALLSQKGFIEKADPAQLEKERKQKEKWEWINSQKKLDALKELEKEKAKDKRKQQRDLGGKNSSRGGGGYNTVNKEEVDRNRAQEDAARFANYTPDFKLVHRDEFGREIGPKEAFKYLSHKFHGKTSGKMKTQKRIDKFHEEIALQKRNSTVNSTVAFNEKVKESGSAHIVLSVGNKGVVPADIPLTKTQPPKKPTNTSKKQVKPVVTEKTTSLMLSGLSKPSQKQQHPPQQFQQTAVIIDTTTNAAPIHLKSREKVVFTMKK